MNSRPALETQISAVVSPATRILLEKRARATGVKKSYLIEQALLHHLQALDALPAEVIINPTIMVSRKSGQEILKRIAQAQRPTKQLRALMRNRD